MRAWLAAGLSSLLLSPSVFPQVSTQPRTLEMGRPIKRELLSTGVHSYQVGLTAGQFLEVIVDQLGIDLVVKLFDPTGRQLSEIDSSSGLKGQETVLVLAKASGKYRLDLFAVDKNVLSGQYAIRIAVLRVATEQDKLVDVAAALAAAKTDAERLALMPKDKELPAPDLERLLISHGEGLTRIHEFERALAIYQIAFGMAERRGSKPTMAQVLSNRGLTLWQMGDYTQALGAYHRSMVLLEELQDRSGVVRMLYNLGLVNTSLGNYELALEYDLKFLAVAEALDDKRMIAHVMPSIGIIYSAQGNYIKAMEYYEKALASFGALGDQGGVVAALLNIAGIYSAQNNLDLALEYQQKALALTGGKIETAGESMHTNRFAAGVLLDMSNIYVRKGEYKKALECSLKSLDMAQALKNPAMIVSALGIVGEIYLIQQNYPRALESFQKALNLSDEAGDRVSVAQLLGRAGAANQAMENYAEAVKLEQQSTEMAKNVSSPETLWYSRMIAGNALAALGQTIQARQAFDEAISTVEELRLNVAGGEVARESFFENKIRPYHEMVRLLISQNNLVEGFKYSEKSKARVLLDVLLSGKVNINKAMTAQELEEERRLNSELVSLSTQILREEQSHLERLAYLQSQLERARLEYEEFQTRLYVAHPELKVKRGQMKPINIEEAVHLLPNSQCAALEFMVTADRTYLFVLTKDIDDSRVDLKVYSLDIRADVLAQLAERFQKQLSQGDLDFQAQARELYDLLLKPAQNQLFGKSTLIIVPDNVLWNLPFQAIKSPDNHYLIEDHAIFYAPSLTVLREMVTAVNKREDSSRSKSTLLAFGNPTVRKQTAEGFQRSLGAKFGTLPETEKQVMALGQLYGPSRSRIYTGSEAREDRAKRESGEYRILQFATHGVLNDRSPMYSYLVLSQPPNDSREDGLLEAREMLGLDLRAEMVVLSACETGRGRVGSGEGIIGVSWALFVAGSAATVVSQWKVESVSTTELMLEFHRNLESGGKMMKARALQQAAIKLLRENKYAHPFYWAGFVVMGNGL